MNEKRVSSLIRPCTCPPNMAKKQTRSPKVRGDAIATTDTLTHTQPHRRISPQSRRRVRWVTNSCTFYYCIMWTISANMYLGRENRYHKAARDGNVLMLREGTKRDFNKADEDGMTPTHWAAYDGKLDALRTITGRGGNPDKPDLLGCTPLHYAAKNNHLHCVSYLVNFGCNLWAVDNDGHSAMDTAALADNGSVVRYLDAEMSERMNVDMKKVEKMKRRALEEAERRVARRSHDHEEQSRDDDLQVSKLCTVTQKFREAFNKLNGHTISCHTVKGSPSTPGRQTRRWKSSTSN